MNKKHRRPPVGSLQVASEPFSLGFSQEAGRFIRVKQRVEDDEAKRRALDNEHVFAGNLLTRARWVVENLEEMIAVIVVAQPDVNWRLPGQRSEQLLDGLVIRDLARQ